MSTTTCLLKSMIQDFIAKADIPDHKVMNPFRVVNLFFVAIGNIGNLKIMAISSTDTSPLSYLYSGIGLLSSLQNSSTSGFLSSLISPTVASAVSSSIAAGAKTSSATSLSSMVGQTSQSRLDAHAAISQLQVFQGRINEISDALGKLKEVATASLEQSTTSDDNASKTQNTLTAQTKTLTYEVSRILGNIEFENRPITDNSLTNETSAIAARLNSSHHPFGVYQMETDNAIVAPLQNQERFTEVTTSTTTDQTYLILDSLWGYSNVTGGTLLLSLNDGKQNLTVSAAMSSELEETQSNVLAALKNGISLFNSKSHGASLQITDISEDGQVTILANGTSNFTVAGSEYWSESTSTDEVTEDGSTIYATTTAIYDAFSNNSSWTSSVTTTSTFMIDHRPTDYRVASQTLTIESSATNRRVDVAIGQDSSAKKISEIVNGVSDQTAVTAYARTEAHLSNWTFEGAGSRVQLTLGNGENPSVQIQATVESGQLGNLVDAINQESGQTGVRATLSKEGTQIDLTTESGEDIVLGNLKFITEDGTDSGIEVSGLSVAITSNTGFQRTLTTDDGGETATTVTGKVFFQSNDGMFSINEQYNGEAGGLFQSPKGSATYSTLKQLKDLSYDSTEETMKSTSLIDGLMDKVQTANQDITSRQEQLLAVSNGQSSTTTTNSSTSNNTATTTGNTGSPSSIANDDLRNLVLSIIEGEEISHLIRVGFLARLVPNLLNSNAGIPVPSFNVQA